MRIRSLFIVALALMVALAGCGPAPTPEPASTPTATLVPTATSTPIPPTPTPVPPTPTPISMDWQAWTLVEIGNNTAEADRHYTLPEPVAQMFIGKYKNFMRIYAAPGGVDSVINPENQERMLAMSYPGSPKDDAMRDLFQNLMFSGVRFTYSIDDLAGFAHWNVWAQFDANGELMVFASLVILPGQYIHYYDQNGQEFRRLPFERPVRVIATYRYHDAQNDWLFYDERIEGVYE